MKKLILSITISFLCIPVFCGTFSSNNNDVVVGLHLDRINSTETGCKGIHGRNFELSGNATLITGKIGDGVSFDGSADGVNSVITSTLWDFTSAFSFVAWIRPRSNAGSFANLASNAPNTASGWVLSISANQLSFVFYGVASPNMGVYPPLDKWSRIAFVIDGVNVTAYYNGKSSGTPQPSGFPLTACAQALALGNGNTQADYNGDMDEVIIYKKALSPAEIKKDYAQYFHVNKYNDGF